MVHRKLTAPPKPEILVPLFESAIKNLVRCFRTTHAEQLPGLRRALRPRRGAGVRRRRQGCLLDE